MKLAALLGNDTLKQRLSALQAKGQADAQLPADRAGGLRAAHACAHPLRRHAVHRARRTPLRRLPAVPQRCLTARTRTSASWMTPRRRPFPSSSSAMPAPICISARTKGSARSICSRARRDLNQQGQNVLLKSIEEPPPYGTFLLLAEHAEQLLPTIRSRCVELRLSPLPEAVLLPALRERFPDVPEGTLRAAGVRAGAISAGRSPSCGTTPGCCRRVPRLSVPTARGVRRSCCRCSPRWSG